MNREKIAKILNYFALFVALIGVANSFLLAWWSTTLGAFLKYSIFYYLFVFLASLLLGLIRREKHGQEESTVRKVDKNST